MRGQRKLSVGGDGIQERDNDPMKYLPFAALAAVVATAPATFAQGASCKAVAAEKKLAGAALNSYMKKCETDAQTACNASATEKKLAGAAKTSFTTKCVRDKTGG
jgi:hypothetical protein